MSRVVGRVVWVVGGSVGSHWVDGGWVDGSHGWMVDGCIGWMVDGWMVSWVDGGWYKPTQSLQLHTYHL